MKENATDPRKHYLASTETFENYLNVKNPFSMVDVYPGFRTQKLLRTNYRIEANDHDLRYTSHTNSEQMGKW
jgi:hypothetical protein